MKVKNIIGLAVAALSCVQFAVAQQPAKKATKLTAALHMPGSKKPPVMMELERGDEEGNFYYLQEGTDQLMQARASACSMFVIQTPADMASALTDFYGGDLEDARKKFAAVKKKYAAFVGLPGAPSTTAALHELTCAVRLLDVAGVKELAASIPGEKNLIGSDAARVAAARVVALIDDTPASYKPISEAVVAAIKKHGANMDTESYGWMRYALGRAAAAVMTESKDKAKAANAAVDFYCQAVMSMHGAHKNLPADAIVRAMTILWDMPGVQDYAAKAAKPMDKKTWGKAPADFRDAVALAHYYKVLYAASGAAANPLVDQLDAYYFNALEGVKKAQ